MQWRDFCGSEMVNWGRMGWIKFNGRSAWTAPARWKCGR